MSPITEVGPCVTRSRKMVASGLGLASCLKGTSAWSHVFGEPSGTQSVGGSGIAPEGAPTEVAGGQSEPYVFLDHTGQGEAPISPHGTMTPNAASPKPVSRWKQGRDYQGEDADFWPLTDALYEAVVRVRKRSFMSLLRG
jgi:hypothetical protein